MSFNLGDVFVTFKSKTNDLNRGIAEVKAGIAKVESTVNRTSFRQFAGNASNAFGGVASAIQGIATRVLMLGTAASVGLGGFIKSAAGLEQTSKSFEVLTGNVDVANKLFAKLAKYANTTPFEFPQIAKAGQVLLGFGIKSSDVYKRITMLGDIAAATGADFESLALVFGQVTATGKLMGQDALQLINNKIPITGILAKKLGVSVQEVKKRMEEGTISAELFTAALEEQTKKGGFAFHGTDVLAQSLNGRLSTLKDTVLEFGRNLLGVRVDPKLGLVIKPGGVFDRFSQLVPKITKGLQDMTPAVQKGFNWVLDHGKEIGAVLAGVAAGFVAAKLAAIGFAIAAAINPFTLIATAIVLLIGALTTLGIKFGWFKSIFETMQPALAALAGVFNTYIKPVFEEIGRIINEELGPALSALWKEMGKLFQSMQPELLEALKIFATIVGGLIVGAIYLAVRGLQAFVAAQTFAANATRGFINWLRQAIAWQLNLYRSIGQFVSGVIAWYNRLPSAVGQVVNMMVNWFKQLPGRIGNAMGGIANSIVAPFKSAFNAIADFWNRTVGSISFKAPDWVPGIGGKGWSIPDVPRLAMGTPNWRGGVANMNEFGPETAVLPKGTKVITADQTRRDGSSGNTYVIQLPKGSVIARSESELADIFEKGIQALDRRLGGAGKPQIMGGTS